MNCPECQSTKIIKYGHTHYGKPRFRCTHCGRQFVENPSRGPINEATRIMIDKMLLERLAAAAIARITGVSERWLQIYVNQKYDEVPQQVEVRKKKFGKLTIQMDEMWSFVGAKSNKQWIWLAMDVETREIVGAYIGDRSKQSAQNLWYFLPEVYRQCAVCYTDFWEAYEMILPSMRHQAVGKETGKTSYIERFNNSMRQRIGRLVRKTLSFSKKLSNHIGAIWNFIHHYNATICT
ncbi:MAG: IS1 family transposase [Okeania sp. SIO2F4]|uniref:IS1 family transposase n=1 Tax=Okeania sp. SIO2F4 TaxID=2607790 RepID=UPI00142ADF50|nr:IS1 family transposase [Okeania sp. SIO2F4]NES05413.1 IS1 family transposase [Okeania sp. SIO2F4]